MTIHLKNGATSGLPDNNNSVLDVDSNSLSIQTASGDRVIDDSKPEDFMAYTYWTVVQSVQNTWVSIPLNNNVDHWGGLTLNVDNVTLELPSDQAYFGICSGVIAQDNDNQFCQMRCIPSSLATAGEVAFPSGYGLNGANYQANSSGVFIIRTDTYTDWIFQMYTAGTGSEQILVQLHLSRLKFS